MDKKRCKWLDLSKPDYVKYHDEEWGVPVYDDQKLFEYITLESAQAGLSWYTILQRRDGYRDAFANFVPEEVAKLTEEDIARLMENPRIIRNRAKIAATINNAKAFIAIQKEYGSFSKYMWQFVNNEVIVNEEIDPTTATSPISDDFAKDLKKRGFKFIGSTICYAHMQACGMVNDHSIDCFRYKELVMQNRQDKN